MTNSVFIASLIGPVLLAVSISLLLNRATFEDLLRHLNDNIFVIILAGIALLVSGIAIVQTHNIWQGWPVIITLFGWLAIVGGLMRILFAPRMQSLAEKVAGNRTALTASTAISLLLGLFLTGKGFGLF